MYDSVINIVTIHVAFIVIGSGGVINDLYMAIL